MLLRIQFGCVQISKYLLCRHRVAFIDQQLRHQARSFEAQVAFAGRLNPAYKADLTIKAMTDLNGGDFDGQQPGGVVW